MLQYQRNLLRYLGELANLEAVYVKLVKRMGNFHIIHSLIFAKEVMMKTTS